MSNAVFIPRWNWAFFEDLRPPDLYDILQLRSAVFVVEQRCAYQDADGADRLCHHLWARSNEGSIAAYLRVVPPGVKFAEPSLGRIVTSPAARRTGLGRALVREGIRRAEQLYGPCAIRIGAQRYLLKFYQEFGFISTGVEYEEDDIPHTEMLREAGSNA